MRTVEQRISPDSPTVHAAAIDPAFVPGLMPARAAAPDDAEAVAPEPEEAATESVVTEPEKAEPQDVAPAEDAADSDASDSDASDDEGPSCDASDRRASAVADRTGVRLRQDDLEVDFDWKEIGAVEYNTSRNGRRLTVTVHMPNRHQYWVEITASGKDVVQEWTAQLDAVLDAYFEE
ncbi:hypothetical protein [Streptomyces sp. NBC_01465]|uniref:hypothetical protein n=1 Tax=Streptomyces sp. NBC_01465 TaxID=2903878 RepID=UPI002E2EEF4F|nr:hypothetical protein [Streptomyces sp. NBC_01465]